MRVMIDIGHPAHVHLFKHFAWIMQGKGHRVFFTCRENEFELYLLEKYKFEHKSFGRKYSTRIGKIAGMLEFDLKEFFAGLKFKPDVFISHGSIYAAHAAFLLRKPHISLEDTFNFEQINLYRPFTNAILTADYDHPLKSPLVIPYAGYHELAYLHPNRFKPDKEVLGELGVLENEKYVVMRFVSWRATHDSRNAGISIKNKIDSVGQFRKYAKVFISSEKPLPDDLKQFKIKIPAERIHDALAFANLYFGESGTMASESAVLGTPAVYLDNVGRKYTDEEELYGLVFNYSDSDSDQKAAIKKGVEILKNKNIKKKMFKNREKLLNDKIDVTEFMVWFVEQFPDSIEIAMRGRNF